MYTIEYKAIGVCQLVLPFAGQRSRCTLTKRSPKHREEKEERHDEAKHRKETKGSASPPPRSRAKDFEEREEPQRSKKTRRGDG